MDNKYKIRLKIHSKYINRNVSYRYNLKLLLKDGESSIPESQYLGIKSSNGCLKYKSGWYTK